MKDVSGYATGWFVIAVASELTPGTVLPMRPNPRVDDHPHGSELRAMAEECDATYARLLAGLQAAFTGTPDGLEASVRDMWALEYQAVALMHVPLGDDGQTAGPPFTPPA